MNEIPETTIVAKMLYKLIQDETEERFEQKLEDYTNDYDSYSVQYKPTSGIDGKITYTALVMVPIFEEETIH